MDIDSVIIQVGCDQISPWDKFALVHRHANDPLDVIKKGDDDWGDVKRTGFSFFLRVVDDIKNDFIDEYIDEYIRRFGKFHIFRNLPFMALELAMNVGLEDVEERRRFVQELIDDRICKESREVFVALVNDFLRYQMSMDEIKESASNINFLCAFMLSILEYYKEMLKNSKDVRRRTTFYRLCRKCCRSYFGCDAGPYRRNYEESFCSPVQSLCQQLSAYFEAHKDGLGEKDFAEYVAANRESFASQMREIEKQSRGFGSVMCTGWR